jgi:hypothetical protein
MKPHINWILNFIKFTIADIYHFSVRWTKESGMTYRDAISQFMVTLLTYLLSVLILINLIFYNFFTTLLLFAMYLNFFVIGFLSMIVTPFILKRHITENDLEEFLLIHGEKKIKRYGAMINFGSMVALVFSISLLALYIYLTHPGE